MSYKPSAIVTGASSGIGRAIYNWLISQEVITWGVSRRGPSLKLDLMDEQDRRNLKGEVGQVNTLILNHGIMSFREDIDFNTLFMTNLYSYWRLLNMDLVGHGGNIILNASVAGVVGDKELTLYAALKAGVINLTKSYAKKLVDNNIRVNCFSCGFFATNLAGEGPTPPALIDEIPMHREAHPIEIIPVIDMLMQTDYMTGRNIIIDGGLSL